MVSVLAINQAVSMQKDRENLCLTTVVIKWNLLISGIDCISRSRTCSHSHVCVFIPLHEWVKGRVFTPAGCVSANLAGRFQRGTCFCAVHMAIND